MILVIDNYDSFVFNLARYVKELGWNACVVRNNKITIDEIINLNPSHIILSPGPGGPLDAGISIEIVRKLAGKIPILGVCLGHQVIGHVFSGTVMRAKQPMHGKASMILHAGTGLFKDIPSPLKVGRYHSLIVCDEYLNNELTITSRTSEGEIMSFSNYALKIAGVQFHPESVLTDHGHDLVKNFLTGNCWIDSHILPLAGECGKRADEGAIKVIRAN